MEVITLAFTDGKSAVFLGPVRELRLQGKLVTLPAGGKGDSGGSQLRSVHLEQDPWCHKLVGTLNGNLDELLEG